MEGLLLKEAQISQSTKNDCVFSCFMWKVFYFHENCGTSNLGGLFLAQHIAILWCGNSVFLMCL